jgi:hypothetical protein
VERPRKVAFKATPVRTASGRRAGASAEEFPQPARRDNRSRLTNMKQRFEQIEDVEVLPGPPASEDE